MAVVVGVHPADASNRVLVLYRKNQGQIQTLAARWLRSDPSSDAQYFRVVLPPFSAGDAVEYGAVCRCAARQAPPPDDAQRLPASFEVVAASSRGEQLMPRRSPVLPPSPGSAVPPQTLLHQSVQQRYDGPPPGSTRPAVGASLLAGRTASSAASPPGIQAHAPAPAIPPATASSGVGTAQGAAGVQAQTAFLNQVLVGLSVEQANGYPSSAPNLDLAEAIQPPCECKDCDAALSPRAYLADLLDYVVDNLADVPPLTLASLAGRFLQPFGDLLASCEQVDRRVSRVRVCIEVLRRWLGPQPVAGEDAYRLHAYTTLLHRLGTSYEDIRLAAAADPAERAGLASRLGIDLSPTVATGPADELDALTLDPASMTEEQLEVLFGLAGSLRNPLADGVTGGDPQQQLLCWNLDGVAWGRHTDADGRIHASVRQVDGAVRVELYRDAQRSPEQLVAAGQASSPTGPVRLSPVGASGLSGRVDLQYVADTTTVELRALPRLTSWRLRRLRRTWAEADRPPNLYTDPPVDVDPLDLLPIIDPDVIGPDDFRFPYPKAHPGDPDQPFDIWRRRRAWVDQRLAVFRGLTTTLPGPAAGTSVAVPDLDAMLAEMRKPLAEDGNGPVQVWPASLQLSDLDAIATALRDKATAEQARQRITRELHLTLDSFARLMALWGRARLGAPLAADESEEVYAILTQAQKVALFPAWRSEERAPAGAAAAVTLGPDHFWTSATAPREGTWPPVPTAAPLVDPDTKVAELADEVAGRRARALRAARAVELEQTTTSLQDAHLADPAAGLESMLVLALGKPPAGEKSWSDHLAALAARLTAGVDADTARAEITGTLGFSIDGFDRLMAVKAKQEDTSPGHLPPSDTEWAEVYAILTAVDKTRQRFPVWRQQEASMGLAYWEALKAKLPAWRAPADSRQAWQRALRERSAPPVVDPDLVDPGDLLAPFSASDPATILHGERRAWLTAKEASLDGLRAAAPTAPAGLDRMLLAGLFADDSAGELALARITAAIGADRATQGLDGVLAQVLGSPVPDLAALHQDLADPDPQTQHAARRTITESLHLTVEGLGRLAAIRATAAPSDAELAELDGILAGAVLVGSAMGLSEQDQAGVDVSARLAQLGLSFEAFAFLARLRRLAAEATVTDGEWAQARSILVQAQKRRAFAAWRDAEAARQLTRGPDHFQVPPVDPLQFPPPPPPPRDPWRFSRDDRGDWDDALQARIDQQQATIDGVAEAVDATEAAVLSELRDALILASPAAGTTIDAKAKWITDRFLVDAAAGGCDITTRIAQAIETLQGLVAAVRTGQLRDQFPDLAIASGSFEAEWQWIGSYATWRAAMFVFCYPENVLIPSLRRRVTPAFATLVQTVRANRQLTAEAACQAAKQYEDYFRDVFSLTVEASCQVDTPATRAHRCEDRTPPTTLGTTIQLPQHDPLVHLFARGRHTGRVYWSTFDPGAPADRAQSFWAPIEALQDHPEAIVDVLGAVPYRISEQKRYLYLFVHVRADDNDKIAFVRYDLNTGRWDPKSTPLDPPDSKGSWTAVVEQSAVGDQPPHVAVLTWSGEVRDCRMNPEGTAWDKDDWRPKMVDSEGQLLAVDRLLAMVEYDESTSVLFIQRPDRNIWSLAVRGPETRWQWLPGSLADAGTWLGAFSWGRGDEIYAFWRTNTDDRTLAYYVDWEDADVFAVGTVLNQITKLGVVAGGNLTVGAVGLAGGHRHVIYETKGTHPGVFRTTIQRRKLHDLEQTNIARIAPTNQVEFLVVGTGFPWGAMFELTERLSPQERAFRRWQEAYLFGLDQGPATNLVYLREAYYFVAIQLALQLQLRGQYTAALDWFRSVYDYSLAGEDRKIYAGLRLEQQLGSGYARAADWLLDPLDPHAIAELRAGTYTRFTVMSIVRCLQTMADAEFTADTAESVPRARQLYLQALELLAAADLAEDPQACTSGVKALSVLVGHSPWTPVWSGIAGQLTAVGDAKQTARLVETVGAVLASGDPLERRLEQAQRLVGEALAERPPTPTFAQVAAERRQRLSLAHRVLLVQPEILQALRQLTLPAGDVGQAPVVSRPLADAARVAEPASVVSPAELWSDIRAPARDDEAGLSAHAVPALPLPQAITGQAVTGLGGGLMPTPPGGGPLGQPATGQLPVGVGGYVPAPPFGCIPPNPVVKSLRFHAEVQLFKIRNCRNIAGLQRQLDPYAAPTDTVTGLPSIGQGGQLVIPGTMTLHPTPYRYPVLIERAKQLVQLAGQAEAAMLAAFEKRDAALYDELRARQDLRLARAQVQLEDLRVREAEDGVTLAQLQQQRAQIQFDHWDGLLKAGLNSWETDNLIFMGAAAVLDMGAFIADVVAEQYGAGISATAAAMNTAANIMAALASYERRREGWEFDKSLAQQDIQIGAQQIKLSQDHVYVNQQERNIADIRADSAQAVVDFLTTKKLTSGELYDFMSGILEGVYSFLLQQATSTAQLAASQLAFERQEVPPPFIQADYWQAPSDDTGGSLTPGTGPDRHGLTGSARLLQDILQLEQYAMDTNRRKLQLSKTISLAQLAPAEFERFRQTGVLPFATTLEMFDREFPGHYLRLIRRVRTSIIALVPPTLGVRATLTGTGPSRVVVGGDTFQTLVIHRPPEAVSFTSPREATGVAEPDPQAELLAPFEAMGVAANWILQLPRPANPFDYRTIADVLVTIDYSALDSYDYRQQILQTMRPTLSAERPFSFRQQLADQWYDMHNPDQTATPMTVRFRTERDDFPANLDRLKIQHVTLYFPSAKPAEVPVLALRFSEDANPGAVGGAATTVDGKISTRTGNGAAWAAILDKSPVGEWELALPSTGELRRRFDNDEIDDILLVITYSGRTPAWPA